MNFYETLLIPQYRQIIRSDQLIYIIIIMSLWQNYYCHCPAIYIIAPLFPINMLVAIIIVRDRPAERKLGDP